MLRNILESRGGRGPGDIVVDIHRIIVHHDGGFETTSRTTTKRDECDRQLPWLITLLDSDQVSQVYSVQSNMAKGKNLNPADAYRERSPDVHHVKVTPFPSRQSSTKERVEKGTKTMLLDRQVVVTSFPAVE